MSQTIHAGFDRRSRISQGLAALGVLIATAALTTAVGPFGTVLAVLTGIVWYLTSPPIAFAVGQLVFVILLPESAFGLFFLGQAGLILLLFSSVIDDKHSLRAIVALLTSGAVLGATAWLGLRTGKLWVGAIVLLVVTLTIGYLMHRYERVRLGLVKTS